VKKRERESDAFLVRVLLLSGLPQEKCHKSTRQHLLPFELWCVDRTVL
jgi:hypothetical protein